MNKQKLRSKLYIIPIVLIFIVIIMIYHKHYEETVNIIKSEHNAKLNLIEQSIYNETKYTEVISKMIDENIVEDMEKNSKLLVEEYIKDKNILEWNLKGMQSQFDNMDIYIIDERLKVVNSSIKEEIGLDLKFQGNFSQLLKERLNGDKFDSDTMNFSIKESELRKYSYMPTPDNKYLIELSVNIKDSYPEIQDLNIVYLSKSLREKYPFIENIRVYKHNQKEDLSHDLDTVERYYKGNIYIENFS